ncbi:deoxyguanosinetriphosphate triphosphohydrolase [Corynebacterium aquatimens]|uniref:Deoxyguanosinetriphosphate triphosphohydrolase-like protein n=1 Tax=Corynebacterium aquatimens TaxID=1190508 RepID=A0A931GTR4_9CORY|nr:deoxyguanosinetriphosphate triphosphohydrolase [Corynebacterium aquatimens]MBG6122070.1 dGTPase [Corynebacterium aquatimens]WJY65389.1 Deoxyguanosinetriphosphate triphosphohydrolase [Corynebacterium aquatimens]
MNLRAYPYSSHDIARRAVEGEKGSKLSDAPDSRDAFSRDRARVLHSAALRRLADKTQVVGPRDGDTPRTRLTHSLEVAQISRGIGAGLGLNPDLCEMAGLTHDIGHPPYGHNGEVALNQLAADCGGFEGNAQTLRILSRLEPKVLIDGTSYGLNLTRAALDAACKYPRTRTNPDGSINRKYGAYDEDADILAWVREGHVDDRPPIEAQVMDCSDDIAYSVHDVEDGIVSGRITLKVLWDFVELAALAHKGAAAFGGTADELIAAADSLRALPIVAAAADFDHSLHGYVTLKKMTSELVGRYVGAVTAATRDAAAENGSAYDNAAGLGRMHGDLVIPPDAEAEVRLLKTVAVLYVMDMPAHIKNQDRQRDRIIRVHDYLTASAPGALDPMFAAWWLDAERLPTADEVDAAKKRVIIDQIASMTESRLERTAKKADGLAGFIA